MPERLLKDTDRFEVNTREGCLAVYGCLFDRLDDRKAVNHAAEYRLLAVE